MGIYRFISLNGELLPKGDSAFCPARGKKPVKDDGAKPSSYFKLKFF
jgi:hypothetical protein